MALSSVLRRILTITIKFISGFAMIESGSKHVITVKNQGETVQGQQRHGKSLQEANELKTGHSETWHTLEHWHRAYDISIENTWF